VIPPRVVAQDSGRQKTIVYNSKDPFLLLHTLTPARRNLSKLLVSLQACSYALFSLVCHSRAVRYTFQPAIECFLETRLDNFCRENMTPLFIAPLMATPFLRSHSQSSHRFHAVSFTRPLSLYPILLCTDRTQPYTPPIRPLDLTHAACFVPQIVGEKRPKTDREKEIISALQRV
jgi:hypothetical protein